MADLALLAPFVATVHEHLANPTIRKAALVGVTWLVVGLLVWLTTFFFNRIDAHLTEYGVPERKLGKIDFFVNVFLVLIGAFVTLFILGVGGALWGAVAVTSVAGIIVGMAAQQVGQNLLAGLVILFERPFTVGDTVELDGHTGSVTKVSLYSTTLVTADGPLVMVPNSRVLGTSTTNYSINPDRRVVIGVDVRESVDMDRVREVIMGCLGGEEHLIQEDKIRVYVKDSIDEGVRFEIRYHVQRDHYFMHCLPTAMTRVLEALNEAGIETAMPTQRHYQRAEA